MMVVSTPTSVTFATGSGRIEFRSDGTISHQGFKTTDEATKAFLDMLIQSYPMVGVMRDGAKQQSGS